MAGSGHQRRDAAGAKNDVDAYLSPDAIADRWQRDHPVSHDPDGAALPHPIKASEDPAKAAVATKQFLGVAEQSLAGDSVFHHYAAAAAANYDAAPFAGPNSLSPARDAAADRQAKKEHILKSRPTSKDRARWSDEAPFVPPAAGPPPDAGADFFA